MVGRGNPRLDALVGRPPENGTPAAEPLAKVVAEVTGAKASR